ncbi:hypothetical protein Mapa_015950 [Marchantia paleacea]|nr:hypothetical protein Mapa_015950 [Marchantia paleacea]
MPQRSRSSPMDLREIHSSSDLQGLDVEQQQDGQSVHFPEELIEGILARVSYPSLYKARLLCRSWCAKFLNSPSEPVHFSAPFQKEVTAAAGIWSKYGPVSVLGKELVGYDGSSNHWRKLALHGRVPVDLCEPAFDSWRLAFAGSLMCAFGRLQDGSLQLLVANVLTGDWKVLPCPPEIRGQPILDFRLVRVDSQHYKVLVHNLPSAQFQAHVYDSNRNCGTWTSFSDSASPCAGIRGLSPFSAYADAYIGGKFYCMSGSSTGGLVIWKFTSGTGVWEEFLHSVEFEGDEFPGGMFDFGSKFLVVTLLQANSIPPAGDKQSCLAARVYELNVKSLKLIRISKSPQELVIGMHTASLVADAESVYFCDIPDQGSASFSRFSVKDGTWSTLPSSPPEYKWKWGRFSTFEPGLSPFASP